MPRSPHPERDSVPPSAPPLAGDRSTEKKLLVAAQVGVDSTRDAAQEDFLFHLYRGSELLQDNRVLEAKEELEYALTLQPRDAKGQDLLAAVYFRIGLYPRAITIYEQLERQFPRDTSLKINLALSYLKTAQPDAARAALHEVVRINPNHRRAWGYLGIAHEKTGDFDQAQVAFERGGHAQMAKRMAERRNRVTVPAPAMPAAAGGPEGEVREVAGMAFEELDAGELNFALAEPGTSNTEVGTWHAVELGAAKSPHTKTLSPPSIREPGGVVAHMRAAGVAQPGEVPTVSPPPSSLLGGMIAGIPSSRAHVPTPVISEPPPEMIQATRMSLLSFPDERAVVLHPSGLALVQVRDGRGFAVRLEAMRLAKGTIGTSVIPRRVRDKETNEVLGGVGSPIVRVEGNAELVIGARGSHHLIPLALDDNLAFVREDLLLGFELCLGYENGKLVTDDADALGIVQIRGTGTMMLELLGPFVTVDASPARAILVRREWIVGWIGRLVPRALPASEAPAGQRGLVSFTGEGTVMMAGR